MAPPPTPEIVWVTINGLIRHARVTIPEEYRSGWRWSGALDGSGLICGKQRGEESARRVAHGPTCLICVTRIERDLPLQIEFDGGYRREVDDPQSAATAD